MASEEPLLQRDNSRFVLFPIKHPDLYEAYKESEACIWTAEEIDLAKDDFEALSEGEKTFVKTVLAFFAAADGIVNENLALNFSQEVTYAEARAFYATQIFIEAIHGETYSLLIDTYIRDPKERDHLFNALDTIPAVAEKGEWAKKFLDPAFASFPKRLLAFAVVEAIFFSGAFASIFWLRKNAKLPGLGLANQFISRDEGMHAKFAALLYRDHVVNKLPVEEVHEMISEAVEIESEFWKVALPVSLIGLNPAVMGIYIEYVADVLLDMIGVPKLYRHSACPFAFMENISLENRTNFFESRVSEYRKSHVATGAASSADLAMHKFKLDDDF